VRPTLAWRLLLTLAIVGGSLANIGYATAMSALPTRSPHIIINHAYFAGIALGNKCSVIWAWYFLVINTALTASIVFTIVFVYSSASDQWIAVADGNVFVTGDAVAITAGSTQRSSAQ
jgi:hypothetical protein